MDFFDENGRGYAQSDLFLVLSDKIVLFECKLTESAGGHEQLSLLYGPLLSYIYSRPLVLVQVCKNLRRGFRRIEITSLEEAIASTSQKVLTWQWLP